MESQYKINIKNKKIIFILKLDYKAGRCIEIKSGAKRRKVELFWGGLFNKIFPRIKNYSWE